MRRLVEFETAKTKLKIAKDWIFYYPKKLQSKKETGQQQNYISLADYMEKIKRDEKNTNKKMLEELWKIFIGEV